MTTRGEGAPGDLGGVGAGDGHQHPAGARELAEGGVEAARPRRDAAALGLAPQGEELVDAAERGRRRPLVGSLDHHQQVIGPGGAGLGVGQARLGQHLAVGGRRHHRRGAQHAGLGGEAPLQLEKHHRVEVGAGTKELPTSAHGRRISESASPHASSSSSASARAASCTPCGRPSASRPAGSASVGSPA